MDPLINKDTRHMVHIFGQMLDASIASACSKVHLHSGSYKLYFLSHTLVYKIIFIPGHDEITAYA